MDVASSKVEIRRYETIKSPRTMLNPLDDVLGWLEYLTSEDYITRLLTSRHGFSASDAKARTKLIIPCITDALLYIQQALNGPQEVSFLPTYYAILNLAKVYVSLGPHFSSLPAQRWHGVNYDASQNHKTLLADVVVLHPKGAMALFYEKLSGKPVTHKQQIRMASVYSCVRDISFEYRLATGQPVNLASIRFSVMQEHGQYQLKANIQSPTRKKKVTVKELAPLPKFRPIKGEVNAFISPKFRSTPDNLQKDARNQIDTRFLYYHSRDELPLTALTSSALPFPEEFPIALIFFHISSVIRYQPERFAKIRQSTLWPVAITARRHCLLKFLLLFWSQINNDEYVIETALAR